MTIFVIALLAAALISVILLSNPRFKGWIGEKRVAFTIGRTCKGERYVINNYILLSNGRSSQIDHIVINKNGVFVIETKNYKGSISGMDSDKYWVQTVKGKGHTVYSPVMQNTTHVSALSKVLGEDVFLTGIVVFVGADISGVHSNCTIPVSVLKSRLAIPQKKKPYTPCEIKSIYERILALKSNLTNSEHIGMVKSKRELIAHGFCPRCNGILVLKTHGEMEFYGCSSYPECKFTVAKKGVNGH